MNASTGFCQCLVASVLVFFCSLAKAEDPLLAVSGEIKAPLRLTLSDLQAMPGTKVTANDHDGKTANYEGVLLSEILRRAGVPQGEALRGDALSLCVLVKAADGYQVTFAPAELDPLFTERKVLLAYRRDGASLDAKAGPLRLVIPEEKRHGRWVRQVVELEILRVGMKRKP